MAAGEGLGDGGHPTDGARARVDGIRRALAVTTDESVRSRLRVRLADLLSALGDAEAALGELRQAAAEGPVSAGLLFGLRALAPALGARQTESLRLTIQARRPGPIPASVKRPSRTSRGATASAAAGTPAAPTAAGGAASTAGTPPATTAAVTTAAATNNAATATTPTPLPRPAASHPSSTDAATPADAVELAFAALADGKPVRARRLGVEAARAARQTPVRAGGPVPALASDSAPDLVSDLVSDLAPAPVLAARLGALVTALERRGARRESLLLERALAERDGSPSPSREDQERAIAAVVARARAMEDVEMAARWQMDVGVDATSRVATAPAAPAAANTHTTRIAMRFRAVQAEALRAVVHAEIGEESDVRAPLEHLLPLLGGHAGRAEALKLGERLAGMLDSGVAESRLAMLRTAFTAETAPRRREALALRWSAALSAGGDRVGALAALELAIHGVPAETAGALRGARADLLRKEGREAELVRALEDDARVAIGPARTALLSEQARLLDRLGEPDRALEVRLGGLQDVPADLGLLAAARQRLEAVGRLDRSLELVTAAIPGVHDRVARAGLLRDVANLAEAAAGDRERAARAWLEVVSLQPDDTVALHAAERLLRQTGEQTGEQNEERTGEQAGEQTGEQTGDMNRLEELLSWWAARETEPTLRAPVLWRLAELLRLERNQLLRALALYRELAEGRGAERGFLAVADEDWQRRDDLLAVHTARALAAPTASAAAQAVADRARSLMAAGRIEDADRDLTRALDLDPAAGEVVRALEDLFGRRGDFVGLRQRLTPLAEAASGIGAAHLWTGVGRADEALGDTEAARSAYERAAVADSSLRAPLTRLRELAAGRGDWNEAAQLLQKEIALCPTLADRVEPLIELGVVLADHLAAPARAMEALDAALAFEPANSRALDAMFGAALAAGAWERSAQALETMLTSGLALADTSQRYHRLGLAAEKAGQTDRALGFYSRSYARNPLFRPTLERLSEVCFARQQWENAWKATEHLIERHGADLDRATHADLALRSALADLHVAQRLAAANRVAAAMPGPVSQAGIRDVADSWASLRFERRLLGGVDGDRRARVLARLAEVLTLTQGMPSHGARSMARETLAALAMVDGRWAEALDLLDVLGSDTALDARRRCLFLVAAGDLLVHQQGDRAGAALRYQRARLLNPGDTRLERAMSALDGSTATGDNAHELAALDEMASTPLPTMASSPSAPREVRDPRGIESGPGPAKR